MTAKRGQKTNRESEKKDPQGVGAKCEIKQVLSRWILHIQYKYMLITVI